MLNAKSQDYRTSGLEKNIFKVLIIYGHGGHLGHATWIVYTNFRSPLPTDTPHDIWLWLTKWF